MAVRHANHYTKQGWIGAVTSLCFLHSSLSLFSIWTDLKSSEKIPGAPAWWWGEWIWLTRPSGLHRNSPQGLNISSIRVFDQIADPEIPITLRPPKFTTGVKYQFHQGFWPDRRSGNPNHPSPHINIYRLGQKSWQLVFFFFSEIPVRWKNLTYTDERTRC